ncbi:MAG: regulatory iron-sulfur-containing complex subunit RicT [candidate division WOR-3 bacterium]
MLYFVKFHGVKYPMESEFTLKKGELVICEIKKEQYVGEVDVEIRSKIQPVGKISHIIYDTEKEKLKENKEAEKRALEFFKERVKQLGLPMKVIGVDREWNGKRYKFYFVAEKRIDFRELVKDLRNKFKCIIELRHLGIRDYAGFIGGLGLCGNALCCNTFLKEKPRIKLESARNQDIYISPSRISGLCGRLLCCLNFEADFYDEFTQAFPEREEIVRTDKGEGKVLYRNMLMGIVIISYPDETQEEIPIEEIKKRGEVWIQVKKQK